MEEEIEYRRSISSVISAVLYDDNDEDENIWGYQRRLIANAKITSAVKVKVSAIALDNVLTLEGPTFGSDSYQAKQAMDHWFGPSYRHI